ncbi:Uncharacterised protein [BD1-7 clade bacterium]|uniref:Polyketide cyclase / dehydrase and lipid transport n=1 Tax=BD1-7 clade bacterium TaxID=2029982 RepID=A0A5S9PIB8_9GAMM|nr:Uncharacterised protein [BD1-7 clade bacterium]CAA0103800.1 Uncharacterised protein [BD1-7 clade bacterium]
MIKAQLPAVTVHAPIDEVWRHLSAIEKYPQWNRRATFDHKNQPVVTGRKLRMRVRLFGMTVSVPAVIECLDHNRELRWKGGIPGIYTGSHYFRLTSEGNETVLVQGEDFNGIAVPLLWPVIKAELHRLYAEMSDDLAAVSESRD